MASQDAKDLLARMVSHPAQQTEQVIYRPNGGKDREITALVDRTGSDSIGGPSRPVFLVTAVNDRLDGISAAEIDRGGDKIAVDEKYGEGDPQDRNIGRMSFQDPDWITVESG